MWRMEIAGWPLTREAPLGGEPMSAVFVKVGDSQLTVRYVIEETGIVFRAIEGEDVTATHLRALRLGELRAQLTSILQKHPERVWPMALWGKLVEDGIAAGTATATEAELEHLQAAQRIASHAVEPLATAGPKVGRGADHDFYREIALNYIETLEAHGTRKVVTEMAKGYGVDRDKVAVWVRRARETGWLEKRDEKDVVTGAHVWRGRAYGGPGPRLIRWLEEQEEHSDTKEDE